MNALFALLCLFSSAQDTHHTSFKKIEITADPLADDSHPLGLLLTRDYKSSPEDGLLEISNLNFAGGTNRPRYLQIRGQGETSVYETTPNHSVSSWIDDIDVTGLIVSWPQTNVSKSEIKKTSQSVTDGSMSIAGALHHTLHTSKDLQSVNAIYESQNAYQLGFEKNISKTSRLFFYRIDDPSFFKNSYLSTNGATRDEYYVSLKNDFWQSDNWSVSSTHIGMNATNGYDVWSLRRPDQDDDYTTLSDHPGSDDLKLQGHSLHAQYQWAPHLKLRSVSSYTRAISDYSYDADWGNNQYWSSISGWNQNYDYVEGFGRQRRVWHQKLILEKSNTMTGMHFYGLDEDSDILDYKDKVLRENIQSEYRSQNIAIFHQSQIALIDTILWSVSGRLENQSTRFQSTLLSRTNDEHFLGAFESRWSYQLSHLMNSYALVSRGFKGAGVNVDPSSVERFYGPEQAITYEIGTSFNHFEGTIEGAVFMIDQRDKQLKVSRQNDPSDPSSFVYEIRNAARAQSLGAELTARYRWSRFRVEAQMGLLQAELRDYFFENQQLRGLDLAHSPEWSYALSLTRDWSHRITTNISVVAKDDFAFSNNHDQRSQSFHIANLGMTYQNDRWRMSFWLKNIFDERYATRGFFFANEPPNWQNKLYTQYGPPRQGGLSLAYLF